MRLHCLARHWSQCPGVQSSDIGKGTMVVCEARSQTLLPLLTYIGQAIDSKLAFESILWFQSQDQTTASKWVKDRQEGHGWPWLVWKLQRCYNSKYIWYNSTSTCGVVALILRTKRPHLIGGVGRQPLGTSWAFNPILDSQWRSTWSSRKVVMASLSPSAWSSSSSSLSVKTFYNHHAQSLHPYHHYLAHWWRRHGDHWRSHRECQTCPTLSDGHNLQWPWGF